MSEGLLTGINCPNDPDHGQMYVRGSDRACVLEECGYSEPHSDIHDADTKEIVAIRVFPLCEADGCKRNSDVSITVNGQKREVCDICAEQHYEQLDEQQASDLIPIEEEREEGIGGGE